MTRRACCGPVGPAGRVGPAVAEQTFAAVPASSRAARAFTLAALPGLPTEASYRVALLVSELASNAVVHAGTPFAVRVERAGDEVRIAVTDTAGGYPAARTPSAGEPGGRGLHIVEALAETWGVARAHPHATTVWCTVALDPRRA